MVEHVEPRFPGDCEGKRCLPFPYDLDLSGVLRHVTDSRRTAAGRAALANDPLTAAYLCAGKRLLAQHLGPDRCCECAADHDSRSLLSFLSQRNVVDTLRRIDGRFPRRGTLSSLRDRWPSHGGFVADLISFAVWRENYRPGYRRHRADVTRRLVHDEDFVRAVQETAYWHTDEGARLTSVRLSLALMAASADGDPDVAEAISGAYRDYLGSWRGLYEDVMRARGLRLRPGLTMDDLANALSAATDGTILRAVGDPAVSVLDHERQRSLMGTVALAILNSFLQRADDADGLTLEEAVAERLLT
jgi:hypothetical protein